MKSIALKIALLSLLLSCAQWAAAFGQNGHRIVAQIGENHLTRKTRKAISKIIGSNSLAQIATWPDEIRSDSGWDFAKPWHFLSIDDDEPFDGLARSDKGDLIKALERFEKVLQDPEASQQDKWQALAFYVHFVGDIHQPLHVGRRDDYGGNSVKVKWFGEPTNLHTVWDEELLGSQNLSFSEFATFLDQPTKDQITEWQSSSYWDWAKESKAVRDQVYDFSQSKTDRDGVPELSYQYVFENKDLIEKRMLKGGVRLAGKLNEIFGK